MNALIIILVFIGCLVVGGRTPGASCFALLLCGCCFVLGVYASDRIVQNKVKNGELLEIGGKYYEVKYVKDKIK
nr:MAG TPA: protein of unknown function (DUF4094) [Caudoviricetes sp.]